MSWHLTHDTLSPDLVRLAQSAKHPINIYGAGAKAVQKGIVDDLLKLEARGNAKGWPSQKFYAGGANSVRKHVGIARLDDHGAIVEIADPRFIHHITGGTVTAKRAGALAIPLTAEAAALQGKGTLRQSAPDLVQIKTRKGAYLARPTAGKTSAGDRLRFLFILLKSVTHKPHPGDAPDPRRLNELARDAMVKAAQILLRAGK